MFQHVPRTMQTRNKDETKGCFVISVAIEATLPPLLTSFDITNSFLLKVFENVHSEMLLQTIRVKSEQTFESITETVVSILDGHFAKLFVHFTIEVFAKEKGPETEKSDHFLTLANT